MSGSVSYHTGLAAEGIVEARYAASGHALRARRWRGQGGEIDLILERGGETVFVEVKKARSIASAATRLSQRQMRRILDAAAEYAAGLADGLGSAMRFDLACVDSLGRVEVIENAIWD